MAGDENRLADTPWWAGGDLEESEEGFRYPSELLGTSWGSYLASLPPTAHAAGRKVLALGKDRNILAAMNGGKHEVPPKSLQKSSPPRAPAPNPSAEPAGAESSAQPRPHRLQRLSAALRLTADALASCGIDHSPLSHASATVAKLQEQRQAKENQGDGPTESGDTVEDVVDVVLEALASQAKKLEEHATSLQRTATGLARNQQQFARDQRDIQQTIEAAFSQIVAQQKLLEKRKDSFSLVKKDCQKEKSYPVGLREGQHRLALMQTRKEHSRLEKILLQQQRDVRKLEQAYKATKAELAAEQYNSEQIQKRIAQSGIPTRNLHKGIRGLREKFHDHNQQLQQLVHQLEASRRELAETGSRLRAREREAHISTTSPSTLTHHQPLTLPHINVSNPPLRNHHSVSSTQLSLPLISTQQPSKAGPRHFSLSELMELAKFRSPGAAREVISWLKKEGAISDK